MRNGSRTWICNAGWMLVYEFVCNLICFLVLLLVNMLGHDTHIQNSHPAGGRLPLVYIYIYIDNRN